MVAVICEYNPFHNGHARHLRLTREAFPRETIVCIQSGAFTQRGEPAILEKCARAEAAIRNGADLVAELPAAFVLAGARDFASGGVRTAKLLGADTLSFGSECGDLSLLRRTAELLEDEARFSDELHRELENGMSYAAARYDVVRGLDPEAAALLRTPNDILGVEYLRELNRLGMRGFAVLRNGAGHDSTDVNTDFPSASALRNCLREAYLRKSSLPENSLHENSLHESGLRENSLRENGLPEESLSVLSAHMPQSAFAVLQREQNAGRAPVFPEAYDSAVLACLRDYTPEMLLKYSDFSIGEGVEYRLRDALRENGTIEAACTAANSKRYPTARIRRAIWRSLLRLPREWAHEEPPFLRILALNEKGAEVIKKAGTAVTIISRGRQAEALDERGKLWFQADERAGDLFALGYPCAALRVCGNEKRLSPVYVPQTL